VQKLVVAHYMLEVQKFLGDDGVTPWEGSTADALETRCSPCVITPHFVTVGQTIWVYIGVPAYPPPQEHTTAPHVITPNFVALREPVWV